MVFIQYKRNIKINTLYRLYIVKCPKILTIEMDVKR
jgi:hypothetical protein